MKREARLLLVKACDSLLLCIEHFNRPHDRGRVTTTLILLDHSFEMLLKAVILERGGKIKEPGKKETIGFDACVRKGLSDGSIQFLVEEQALQLQAINGLRDAAQHHLLDISEGHLYIHTQAGVTLFRDLLKAIFGQELREFLPERVLPVSTTPPTDLVSLFEHEVEEIQRLLRPGSRRKIEAEAKLRPLAVLDAAIRGEKGQPGSRELRKLADKLVQGVHWETLFPGVAAVELAPEGTGPNLALRLTKKEGIPVHLVKEGTPEASVVGVRRVDELSFYNLGARELAEKIRESQIKVVAVVDYLGLRDDPACYKEFRIGRVRHKRYSQKAIDRIKDELEKTPIETIWRLTIEQRKKRR
jgi:hypothetical protein